MVSGPDESSGLGEEVFFVLDIDGEEAGFGVNDEEPGSGDGEEAGSEVNEEIFSSLDDEETGSTDGEEPGSNLEAVDSDVNEKAGSNDGRSCFG